MIHQLKPRLAVTRLFGSSLALAAALVAAPPARAAEAPLPPGAADSALALFDGGAVFPAEYAQLWVKVLIAQRPPGNEEESRQTFLTRVVDRKLLAAEISKRPFTPSTAEQRQLDQSRNQLVQNLLFRRTVGSLPDPSPEELEVFVRRQNTIAIARYIVFSDWDRARAWRNRLLTGTPMTAFESAVARDGATLAVVDSFRLIAAEQIPDTLAHVIWGLRPGQVSEIIGFSGNPTMIHLMKFESRPARVQGDADLKAEFQRRQYDMIRERERQRLADSVERRYEEDAMELLLAGHLRLPPRRDVDSSNGLPVIRANLPLPPIAMSDTGRVVARTRNGDTTIGAYLRYWGRVEPYARIEVRERAVLEGAVDRVALDGEILRQALAQGLDRDSTIVALLDRQREGYALDDFFREEIEMKVIVSEKEVRALWEKNPVHYNDVASLQARLISVERKSIADTVLARLHNGASFAAMAQEYSMDQSTLENAGRTGIIYRGSQRNAGLENAMFATEIDAIGGPESTPEGWVLWKIDTKTPGIERTFEMAREMVERDAKIMAGERLLEKKLAGLRKKARVKFFPERIAAALQGLS